jgi:hypothetical protein
VVDFKTGTGTHRRRRIIKTKTAQKVGKKLKKQR